MEAIVFNTTSRIGTHGRTRRHEGVAVSLRDSQLGYCVLVASEPHDLARTPRGLRGAHLFCDVARTTLAGFAQELLREDVSQGAARGKLAPERRAQVAERLAGMIAQSWRQAVASELLSEPATSAELSLAGFDARRELPVDDLALRLYGADVSAMLVMPENCVAMQMGGGVCAAVLSDGSVMLPLESEEAGKSSVLPLLEDLDAAMGIQPVMRHAVVDLSQAGVRSCFAAGKSLAGELGGQRQVLGMLASLRIDAPQDTVQLSEELSTELDDLGQGAPVAGMLYMDAFTPSPKAIDAMVPTVDDSPQIDWDAPLQDDYPIDSLDALGDDEAIAQDVVADASESPSLEEEPSVLAGDVDKQETGDVSGQDAFGDLAGEDIPGAALPQDAPTFEDDDSAEVPNAHASDDRTGTEPDDEPFLPRNGQAQDGESYEYESEFDVMSQSDEGMYYARMAQRREEASTPRRMMAVPIVLLVAAIGGFLVLGPLREVTRPNPETQQTAQSTSSEQTEGQEQDAEGSETQGEPSEPESAVVAESNDPEAPAVHAAAEHALEDIVNTLRTDANDTDVSQFQYNYGLEPANILGTIFSRCEPSVVVSTVADGEASAQVSLQSVDASKVFDTVASTYQRDPAWGWNDRMNHLVDAYYNELRISTDMTSTMTYALRLTKGEEGWSVVSTGTLQDLATEMRDKSGVRNLYERSAAVVENAPELPSESADAGQGQTWDDQQGYDNQQTDDGSQYWG